MEQTIRLYEQDAYIKEFEATVLSCEKMKDGYAVVLDRTAFFPEGGGQPADRGTINDVKITDVQIKDNVITHMVDRPLTVGATVTGRLNWGLRFGRMQNHTGEHIVAGLIHTMFGYDNVGFHMSDLTVTLDVSGPLDGLQIFEIEEAANMAIYENRTVTAWFPTAEELPTLDYRSKLDLTENVRLITIDGVDVCACCAPHVARTGEIGLIKVTDHIPYKGGTRITLVSGGWAFAYFCALHNNDRIVRQMLSAPFGETIDFVKRDQDTIASLRAQVKQLQTRLAQAQLEVIPCEKVVCAFTKDADFEAMRMCAESIAHDGQLLALFSINDDGVAYILAQENGDVRETVKALNASFAGKGGGKPIWAQGKLTASKENLLNFFQ